MRRTLALLTAALVLLASSTPASAQVPSPGRADRSGWLGWFDWFPWPDDDGGGSPTPPPDGGVDDVDDPIVFVHGYGMTGSSTWGTMISFFAADGHRTGMENMTYSTAQDLTTTAGEVERRVDRALRDNGASQVDIVCHSMGCLASRHYLKEMGGTAKVDQWVSLGGANKGTLMANACAIISAGCRDMQPGSRFERSLNSGDPTPGPTTYSTLWSRGDGVIIPATNTPIDGATNIEIDSSIDHVEMLRDRDVYRQVADIVR